MAQLAKAHGEYMVGPWLGPSWPRHMASTWLVPGLCNNKKAETKLIFPTET